MTRETFRKVLLVAARTELGNVRSTFINVEKQEYELVKSNKGKTHILQTKTFSELGKGSFGIASQIRNLTSGKMEVIKEANSFPGNRAKAIEAQNDLKNEFEVLTKYHQGSKINPEIKKRVQDCPRCFKLISGTTTSAATNKKLLERKHPYDLFNAITKDRLRNCPRNKGKKCVCEKDPCSPKR